jgi:hypothetical protein
LSDDEIVYVQISFRILDKMIYSVLILDNTKLTDLELNEAMVNAKELGKLKLEHKVGKGIFITNKTYCIIDNNNKYINKAKGINT